MTRHPYSASAVKVAFWFAEFRQEAELLQACRFFEEIEALAREANLFGTRTPIHPAGRPLRCRCLRGRPQSPAPVQPG